EAQGHGCEATRFHPANLVRLALADYHRPHRMVVRRFFPLAMALGLGAAHCSTASANSTSGDSGVCSQPDQDGVVGGDYAFVVEVSDTAFSPLILKSQN